MNKVRKPDWLKIELPKGERYQKTNKIVKAQKLATVCSSARCPNIGECWSHGTATFMILGDICTRGCAFCAVNRGACGEELDDKEPKRVAKAALDMGLDYVVITSVTRDDLEDGGAGAFAKTITEVKKLSNDAMVEILTSDYTGENLKTVLDAGPSVFAHNIETVERLSPKFRHKRFSFENSLKCLIEAKEINPKMVTKSSIMLGAGETKDEVLSAMEALIKVKVNILVIGQYLQPTKKHEPVVEYISPEVFKEYETTGLKMGFDYVAAGPLVRTSYKAASAYVKSL